MTKATAAAAATTMTTRSTRAAVGPPPHAPKRYAVVDLGSNSVRLVVFEGISRNPVTIFNEKAVLRLGRGLETTGRLNDDGVAQAVGVMMRFDAVVRGMGAERFEVLATAAVRDATNGAEFVGMLRQTIPNATIRILSGTEEADYSATGLLSGLTDADGLMADIGGGSLELVRLSDGRMSQSQTLRLGVIRLADRAGGDVQRARTLVEADLDHVPWLPTAGGRTLYLVGGAFRALARLQIARTFYPLNIVHQYELGADEARELTGWVIGASRRALERLPGSPRKRLDDMPYAATVLRRLLRRTSPTRVVFSVDGLREGWYMRHVAPQLLDQPPLEAIAREMSLQLSRTQELPPALIDWTAALFPSETAAEHRLRVSACWMSDCGAHDHPEYRAEQSFTRILRAPGVALSHPARGFLALTMAMRYEAELDQAFLQSARRLLDPMALRRAEILGLALRLAYVLCAGTPQLLEGTSLDQENDRLVLRLSGQRFAFNVESVSRRLERLAQAAGLVPEIEGVPE